MPAGVLDTLRVLDTLSVLEGVSVFIDDIQCVVRWVDLEGVPGYSKELLNTLQKLSEGHYVCVVCDMIQSLVRRWRLVKEVEEDVLAKLLGERLSDKQLVSLTKNLRNSCDLSIILNTIRTRVSELSVEKFNLLDILYPVQTHGHYLHGPKTVMHVLPNYNEDFIGMIIAKELDRITYDKFITKSKVGLISTDWSDKTVKHNGTTTRFCSIYDVYSKEWPAIIVLMFNCFQLYDIVKLYLAMSRARVKCTFIMTYREDNFNDMMIFLKDIKLNDSVKIVKHP